MVDEYTYLQRSHFSSTMRSLSNSSAYISMRPRHAHAPCVHLCAETERHSVWKRTESDLVRVTPTDQPLSSDSAPRMRERRRTGQYALELIEFHHRPRPFSYHHIDSRILIISPEFDCVAYPSRSSVAPSTAAYAGLTYTIRWTTISRSRPIKARRRALPVLK